MTTTELDALSLCLLEEQQRGAHGDVDGAAGGGELHVVGARDVHSSHVQSHCQHVHVRGRGCEDALFGALLSCHGTHQSQGVAAHACTDAHGHS